jgi:RNase P subunit RPR2
MPLDNLIAQIISGRDPKDIINEICESKKVSKKESNYIKQSLKKDQNCKNCFNFIYENKTCRVVEGKVNPNGWSKLWKADTDIS